MFEGNRGPRSHILGFVFLTLFVEDMFFAQIYFNFISFFKGRKDLIKQVIICLLENPSQIQYNDHLNLRDVSSPDYYHMRISVFITLRKQVYGGKSFWIQKIKIILI